MSGVPTKAEVREAKKGGPKKVNLGKKGSFAIKKPGAFREAARKRGMSVPQLIAAVKRSPDKYSSTLRRQAASAAGLRAMGKKK